MRQRCLICSRLRSSSFWLRVPVQNDGSRKIHRNDAAAAFPVVHNAISRELSHLRTRALGRIFLHSSLWNPRTPHGDSNPSSMLLKTWRVQSLAHSCPFRQFMHTLPIPPHFLVKHAVLVSRQHFSFCWHFSLPSLKQFGRARFSHDISEQHSPRHRHTDRIRCGDPIALLWPFPVPSIGYCLAFWRRVGEKALPFCCSRKFIASGCSNGFGETWCFVGRNRLFRFERRLRQ